jgi:hypothetical protein
MRGVTYTRALIVLALAACSFTRQQRVNASTSGESENKSNNNNDKNDVCPNDDESREFFPSFPGGKVPYLGPDTNEPFAFRHYNESEVVLGRVVTPLPGVRMIYMVYLHHTRKSFTS